MVFCFVAIASNCNSQTSNWKISLHFVESALFRRGADRAMETAHILVREFARRDKIPLQFTLLHLMKVKRLPLCFILYEIDIIEYIM
jgi:hypothetical protein